MAAAENKKNLSDPDLDQLHFLLRKDGGDAMSENLSRMTQWLSRRFMPESMSALTVMAMST